MSAKIDLHGSQAESLKSIWLSQAKKFSVHTGDLRDFLQSAHRWSDVWHATVWGMPGAVLQRDFFTGLLWPGPLQPNVVRALTVKRTEKK